MIKSNRKTFYKAGGKVLMAGGYGVLQHQNIGLTLSIDKNYYSRSQLILHPQNNPQIIKISILSQQIKEKWIFSYNKQTKALQQENNLRNLFVESSIKYVLNYLQSKKRLAFVGQIKIDVVFDRGFLSQKKQMSRKDKFIDYEEGCTKTGLGSSACVIVAIIGGILSLFDENNSNMVNVLSQMANLSAQNKLGSNFDISTAVFGTHLYINILPNTIFSALNSQKMDSLLQIDPQIKYLSLNPVIQHSTCFLLDLQIGTDTRKMVTGFLKELKMQEKHYQQEFYKKNKQFVTEIYDILTIKSDKKKIIQFLKEINLNYRTFIQSYSTLVKIPVQPPQFKLFLDDICSIQSVMYAICPGSGGYDAIFIMADLQSEVSKAKLSQTIKEICSKYGIKVKINQININWKTKPLSKAEQLKVEQYINNQQEILKE